MHMLRYSHWRPAAARTWPLQPLQPAGSTVPLRAGHAAALPAAMYPYRACAAQYPSTLCLFLALPCTPTLNPPRPLGAGTCRRPGRAPPRGGPGGQTPLACDEAGEPTLLWPSAASVGAPDASGGGGRP